MNVSGNPLQLILRLGSWYFVFRKGAFALLDGKYYLYNHKKKKEKVAIFVCSLDYKLTLISIPPPFTHSPVLGQSRQFPTPGPGHM